MEIPKKIKIGGHIVKVSCKEKLENLNGDFNWETNTIRIDKSLPQSQKESTLIHEIFHVLNTTLDEIPLGHALLDSLSEQFYQVLSDNKMIK